MLLLPRASRALYIFPPFVSLHPFSFLAPSSLPGHLFRRCMSPHRPPLLAASPYTRTTVSSSHADVYPNGIHLTRASMREIVPFSSTLISCGTM